MQEIFQTLVHSLHFHMSWNSRNVNKLANVFEQALEVFHLFPLEGLLFKHGETGI